MTWKCGSSNKGTNMLYEEDMVTPVTVIGGYSLLMLLFESRLYQIWQERYTIALSEPLSKWLEKIHHDCKLENLSLKPRFFFPDDDPEKRRHKAVVEARWLEKRSEPTPTDLEVWLE